MCVMPSTKASQSSRGPPRQNAVERVSHMLVANTSVLLSAQCVLPNRWTNLLSLVVKTRECGGARFAYVGRQPNETMLIVDSVAAASTTFTGVSCFPRG